MAIGDGSESTIDLTALRAPTARHYITKISQRTLAKAHTTVIEPGIDVAADVAAIRAGNAHRVGNEFSINGRIYGVHGRTLYPVSGPGFHPLNRGAFKALGICLGIYNRFGDSPRAAGILDQSGIGHAERKAALRAWTAAQGG